MQFVKQWKVKDSSDTCSKQALMAFLNILTWSRVKCVNMCCDMLKTQDSWLNYIMLQSRTSKIKQLQKQTFSHNIIDNVKPKATCIFQI